MFYLKRSQKAELQTEVDSTGSLTQHDRVTVESSIEWIAQEDFTVVFFHVSAVLFLDMKIPCIH